MSGPRGNLRIDARRAATAIHGLLALAVVTAVAGCENRNRGISPDGVGLYFPSGIAVDPRVPEDEPSRWLFVLNGNSDLVYNAGSIVPIDLDRFFASWMLDPDRCFGFDRFGEPLAEPPDARFCAPAPCEGCAAPAIAKGLDLPEIGDVGAEPTADIPCRRNAYKPQLIECEDSFFIEEDSAVRLGNFGTSLRGWTREVVGAEPQKLGKLFAAVRGDPSITHVNVTGGLRPKQQGQSEAPLRLDCGQGEDSGLYDPLRCADEYKLTYLRNDPDSARIASEPSNILATPGQPYVLVTHATRPALTLIDMDGQYDAHAKYDDQAPSPGPSQPADTGEATDTGAPGTGTDAGGEDTGAETTQGVEPPPPDEARPNKALPAAIIQMRSLFQFGGIDGGGWGIARRPCGPGNVPALSIGRDKDGNPVDCKRPLLYGGFRTALYVARAFIDEVDPLRGTVDLGWIDGNLAVAKQRLADNTDPAMTATLEQQVADWTRLRELVRDEDNYDQQCLLASEILGDTLYDDPLDAPETKGAFLCDAQIYGAGLIRAAAFDNGVTTGSALLGDMAFSRDGNRLFVVQTNPGGLAYIDTSLDEAGDTRDNVAGLIELCAQPTGMQVFYDGVHEYAAITCYRPQEVFIVDLDGVRVVANIAVGNGPHPMAVDPARDLMYIANTLDKTVSVVDLSPKRPTRFAEIARLGRQVPYNR